MEPFLKRTWAQVDLDALDHNIREIRSAIAPSAKLMCVIKADGYGHGAVPLAKESERTGSRYPTWRRPRSCGKPGFKSPF